MYDVFIIKILWITVSAMLSWTITPLELLKLQGSLSLVAAAIQYLLFFQLSEHPHNEHMPTKEAEAVLNLWYDFQGKECMNTGFGCALNRALPGVLRWGLDEKICFVHQSRTKWEKEMSTHSSILAWEIPWTEKPSGLQSSGLQKSQTQFID